MSIDEDRVVLALVVGVLIFGIAATLGFVLHRLRRPA